MRRVPKGCSTKRRPSEHGQWHRPRQASARRSLIHLHYCCDAHYPGQMAVLQASSCLRGGKMLKWIATIVASVCLFSFQAATSAQSNYATLSGSVLDAQGAAVAQAQVKLVASGTGAERQTI